jgi:hypothetical protein
MDGRRIRTDDPTWTCHYPSLSLLSTLARPFTWFPLLPLLEPRGRTLDSETVFP